MRQLGISTVQVVGFRLGRTQWQLSGRLGISRCARLAVFTSLIFGVYGAGQSEEKAGIEASVEAEMAFAPVIIDGDELFQVVGSRSFSAPERARAIADRIYELAADYETSVEVLGLDPSEGRTLITAGDKVLMAVFPADSGGGNVGHQYLAPLYRDRIKAAILRYRSDRDPQVLLKNTMVAAVVTIALAGLILLTFFLTRRIEKSIEARYKARIRDLKIKSIQVAHAVDLWLAVNVVVRIIRTVILLALGLLYAETVLGLYPWTRFIAREGSDLLLDPLRAIVIGVLESIPDLLFIAVVTLVTAYVLKLLKVIVTGLEHGSFELSGFDPEWAWPTYKIVRLLVVAFAAIVCYPYIPGAESEAFKGVSIFLGVVFSLGSSSTISNIIAGYTMTYRRAFKVGDRVQVGEVVGEVTEIRLQVTHVLTPKNEEVIIPNSSILNSHVVNYSTKARKEGVILHTTVGIGYETPWRQVEAMLLMAAERTPGLLSEPKPFVLEKSLGDFCILYEINVYTDQSRGIPAIYAALHRNILDLFNEYGVQIMTPAYEGDPEGPKVVPREKWFDAPAREPRD